MHAIYISLITSTKFGWVSESWPIVTSLTVCVALQVVVYSSETLETQSILVFIENGTEINKGLMLKLTSLNLVPFQFVKIICGNLVCDSRFSVHDCRHILLRSMKKFVSWHIIGSYL